MKLLDFLHIGKRKEKDEEAPKARHGYLVGKSAAVKAAASPRWHPEDEPLNPLERALSTHNFRQEVKRRPSKEGAPDETGLSSYIANRMASVTDGSRAQSTHAKLSDFRKEFAAVSPYSQTNGTITEAVQQQTRAAAASASKMLERLNEMDARAELAEALSLAASLPAGFTLDADGTPDVLLTPRRQAAQNAQANGTTDVAIAAVKAALAATKTPEPPPSAPETPLPPEAPTPEPPEPPPAAREQQQRWQQQQQQQQQHRARAKSQVLDSDRVASILRARSMRAAGDGVPDFDIERMLADGGDDSDCRGAAARREYAASRQPTNGRTSDAEGNQLEDAPRPAINHSGHAALLRRNSTLSQHAALSAGAASFTRALERRGTMRESIRHCATDSQLREASPTASASRGYGSVPTSPGAGETVSRGNVVLPELTPGTVPGSSLAKLLSSRITVPTALTSWHSNSNSQLGEQESPGTPYSLHSTLSADEMQYRQNSPLSPQGSGASVSSRTQHPSLRQSMRQKSMRQDDPQPRQQALQREKSFWQQQQQQQQQQGEDHQRPQLSSLKSMHRDDTRQLQNSKSISRHDEVAQQEPHGFNQAGARSQRYRSLTPADIVARAREELTSGVH